MRIHLNSLYTYWFYIHIKAKFLASVNDGEVLTFHHKYFPDDNVTVTSFKPSAAHQTPFAPIKSIVNHTKTTDAIKTSGMVMVMGVFFFFADQFSIVCGSSTRIRTGHLAACKSTTPLLRPTRRRL